MEYGWFMLILWLTNKRDIQVRRQRFSIFQRLLYYAHALKASLCGSFGIGFLGALIGR